jgi:hypothetical protein
VLRPGRRFGLRSALARQEKIARQPPCRLSYRALPGVRREAGFLPAGEVRDSASTSAGLAVGWEIRFLKCGVCGSALPARVKGHIVAGI